MQRSSDRSLALATWDADDDVVPALAAAPVIATKLVPPHLPSVLVDRPARRHLLEGTAQVVAVVAPAGYGKTVLVRQWVDTLDGVAVAWYSLDALDANPLCFWRHLVAALDEAVHLGHEPDRVLTERGPDTAFLHLLVHALASTGRDLVLVLDDLHLLRDRATLDQLALLVDRAGPGFRLVCTARSTPPLPLARWRLQGRAAELGVDDLRFDEDSTDSLLRGYQCPAMADRDLTELVGRSEGWVAGIQLAALARPGDVLRVLDDLPADNAGVADYLVSEVIDALPADQREVALAVSVVDEFDASLAAGLAGRADAGAVIRALDDGNVFLVRTGAESYRFHHLFRDLLRAQVRDTDPQEWHRLHREAARLLAARGQTDAAFGHLVLVDDMDGAFDLVVRPGLALSDQGHGRQFRRWLEMLPVNLEVHDVDLLLDLAFANFTAGRLDEAEAMLDTVAPRCQPDDRRVALRRLAVAVARGDVSRMDGALALSGATVGPVLGGPFEYRFDSVAARAWILRGDLDEAAAALDRAAANADEHARRVTVPALRARLHVLAGNVVEATRLAQHASDEAEAVGVRRNPAVLEIAIASTAAAIAGGDTAAAAVRMEELLDVVDAVDYPYSHANAAALGIELHAQQEGWSATAGQFDELCEQAGFERPAPMQRLLDPLLVRALVAAGRIGEAAEVATAMLPGPDRTIAEASVQLASRQYAQVLSALQRTDGWTSRATVEALVLCAMAATGDDADRFLRAAIDLAMPLGLVSPFLQRGDDLDRILRRLPAEHRSFVDRWSPATAAPSQPIPGIVEPLTPRERELLALLPTHLSNAAIGERLYVSVNTVKTNLRSVYRKLGTASRAETVAMARRVGLLPPGDTTV
ncbi:MAG: AAA family ATPase [Actinobacteria bacterium]|nr:AAA family ATPase [Actinomycetota bacterium]